MSMHGMAPAGCRPAHAFAVRNVEMLLSGGASDRRDRLWQAWSGSLAARGKFKTIVPKQRSVSRSNSDRGVVWIWGRSLTLSRPDGGTSVAVERGAVELATIPRTAQTHVGD